MSQPQSPERVVALLPNRLAAPFDGDIRPLLQDKVVRQAGDAAAAWQRLGASVTTYEAQGVIHGVARDRMTEVIGISAAVGEQAALARSALLECELWQQRRERHDYLGDEMCHRAQAELLLHFCLSAGHGLANVTARLLATDAAVLPELVKHFKTGFEPHSDDHRAWLSCNTKVARDLRRVAESVSGPAVLLPDAISVLAKSPDWSDLVARRGADYHRWRPQSDGMVGVPLRSLWQEIGPGQWRIGGGTRPYVDGLELAAKSTAIGKRCLAMVAVAMVTLAANRDAVIKARIRHKSAPQ